MKFFDALQGVAAGDSRAARVLGEVARSESPLYKEAASIEQERLGRDR